MKTENETPKTNVFISPKAPSWLREVMLSALEEDGAENINEISETEMKNLLDKKNADEDTLKFHSNLDIKIVKNDNPDLFVAKLFGGELGLMPVACFWVEGSAYHPISSHRLVYKDGIVIDAATGLWYGKGLFGEGEDSLEKTLKGLPDQTVGAWVTKIGDNESMPSYQEVPTEVLEAYIAANYPELKAEVVKRH